MQLPYNEFQTEFNKFLHAMTILKSSVTSLLIHSQQQTATHARAQEKGK